MLVLLDENMEATEIHEAKRRAVKKAIEEPASKARNERGALGVAKFKSIATKVWGR